LRGADGRGAPRFKRSAARWILAGGAERRFFCIKKSGGRPLGSQIFFYMLAQKFFRGKNIF